MRSMFSKLWLDDSGFVVSTELVLAGTLLVLGVLVGQTTLRDAVIVELADTADAIQAANQTFSFTAVTGHSSSVSGTVFGDALDFCDGDLFGLQGEQGTGSGNGTCINLSLAPSENG